jgi:DNA invertase Pin-like site-specific DNA recombinase
MVGTSLLRDQILFEEVQAVRSGPGSRIRCAVYTRKSSEEGLEQSFNSLQAQREACESYIASQRHEGWHGIKAHYDDGGYSGGTLERPALKRLLEDIASGKVDTVVVYKVDRLTRSLADFAKIVEEFDGQGISFVSVTQQFNTTTSMGRLTLNVLLSFAQFEREVTGERIRDKVAASKKKGMWMGGRVPLGYDLRDHQLFINQEEATLVRQIFTDYLRLGCVSELKRCLDKAGIRGKSRMTQDGRISEASFSRGSLYSLLANRLYVGEIAHRGQIHPGQHQAIIERNLWEKVAAQLAENRRTRRRRGSKHPPALLTGMLFDDQGQRYTPTHALKCGRRYRYYTSQTVIQGKEASSPMSRLPAHEVEQLVIAHLIAFLQSPRELLQLLEARTVSVAETNQVVAAARLKSLELSQAAPQVLSAFLAVAIERIIVKQSSLDVRIAVRSLTDLFLGHPAESSSLHPGSPSRQEGSSSVSLHCEFNSKRRGYDLRLVVAPGKEVVSRPSLPLIKAVARANGWMERLLSGEISTLEELASETGFTRRYIGRTLRGSFLAPDLTEMILDGLQPSDLTVRRLMAGFPADWPSQRLMLKNSSA